MWLFKSPNKKSLDEIQQKLMNASNNGIVSIAKDVNAEFLNDNLVNDGIYGAKTYEALGGNAHAEKLIAELNSEKKGVTFSCPHCGGNQIRYKHGKRYCAYCNSEVINESTMS